MSTEEFKQSSEKLQGFLEKVATRASIKSGFMKRQRALTGEVFAKTWIIGNLEKPDATLNELAQVSAELGAVVSPQAINQRITPESVAFFERLMVEAVDCFHNEYRIPDEILRQFTAVYLIDASQMSLPVAMAEQYPGNNKGKGKASVKVEVGTDYLSGQPVAIHLQAGRRPDQKSELPVKLAQSNSLIVTDLGFFKMETFQQVTDQQAFFLSRLQQSTGLYAEPAGTPKLDLVKLLRACQAQRFETWIYMGRNHQLPVRLLCQRLPPAEVEKRHRKAKLRERKMGKTYSSDYYEQLAWVIFVTTVPEAMLSFDQLMALYRLRWQIELIFKLWKSQAKLDHIAHWRPERVLCHIYAHLVGLIIFHWVVAPYRYLDHRELSLPKAFAVFQRHLARFMDAVLFDWLALPDVFQRLAGAFSRYARKDSRQKAPSSLKEFQLAAA